MALYLKWKVLEQEFVEWGYAHGETFPIMRDKWETKKARYSSEDTPEMRAKAKEWIRTQRPDATIVSIPD